MNRRTFESPMDWEYQSQGPVDMTSPFAQFSQKSQMASFDSPSKPDRQTSNPFAAAASSSRLSPSKQAHPMPPHSSFFKPDIQRTYTGPSFRNPAFTTPQRRFDDLVFSEMSGAESSPAMTDNSEVPEDTPPGTDKAEEFARMTVTPAAAHRALFGKKPSGRGEVPRGKLDVHHRDKVRKRKRQLGDRDVGSARSRLPHESDDDEDDDADSEWDTAGGAGRGKARRRHGRRGWFTGLLSAIHDHPAVPMILSRWVQLSVNVFVVAMFMWAIWGFISMMRADIASATEAARAKLLAEMESCAHEYTKNRCAPKAERLPALNVVCEEWEMCMNQDPASVMKVQVSAKNVAEIINEFTGVISYKAWGFILSTVIVVVVANNFGFSRLRESTLPPVPEPSSHAFSQQRPDFPMLTSPQRDPHQAYIFAPIGQTPRRLKREFFPDDATDTDASPSGLRSIMAPQTPSGRRSPSKGERGRSPTKAGRSPSKGY